MAKIRRVASGRLEVGEALAQISERADLGGLDAKEIHVKLLANGDIAYRVHPASGEDPEGGVIFAGEHLGLES